MVLGGTDSFGVLLSLQFSRELRVDKTAAGRLQGAKRRAAYREIPPRLSTSNCLFRTCSAHEGVEHLLLFREHHGRGCDSLQAKLPGLTSMEKL